jgi:hypothetical protein
MLQNLIQPDKDQIWVRKYLGFQVSAKKIGVSARQNHL